MSLTSLLVSTGLSVAGNLFQYSNAQRQLKQAEIMAESDPGYRGNPALDANAGMASNRFTNYTLPGYSSAMDNINRNAEAGYRSVIQGAGSSSDILDAATRLAYGSSVATNQLNEKYAEGENQAFREYLTANQLAGQEIANANAWDREQYLRNKADVANLTNTGLINKNNAIQGAIGSIGTAIGYASSQGMFGGNGVNAGYSLTPGQQINTVMPGATVESNPVIAESSGYGTGYNNNIYIPKRIN